MEEPLAARARKVMTARILPDHFAVLQCLAERTLPNGKRCIPFSPIMETTEFTRQRVRFICRALARKGLAEFFRALWTEDGEPAGSGYCITHNGYRALSSKPQRRLSGSPDHPVER